MFSSTERELHRLREEAVQMQVKVMDISQEKEVERIEKLSKATMTDEGHSCRYCNSSISVTDSATQVNSSLPVFERVKKVSKATMTDKGYSCRYCDSSISVTDSATQVEVQRVEKVSKTTQTYRGLPCRYCESTISVKNSATQISFSPPRPTIRDTAVSPIRPTLVILQDNSTQTSTNREKRVRFHRRTWSEGDSTFYRRKARDAFHRVKRISQELRDISLSQCDKHQQAIKLVSGGNESAAPEIKPQSTTECHCQCRVDVELSEKAVNSSKDVSEPGKCVYQQQAKTLQKKLRLLTKQVYI